MSKIERSIPARQLHWKKYAYLRNKEQNIFYMCQCGKKYTNFPALYLHFQRKHHRKIKNLHDPSQFEVINSNQETIYLYFIKKSKSKKEEVSRINSLKNLHIMEMTVRELQRIFGQFAQQSEHLLGQYLSLKQCNNFFQYFTNFFREFLLSQNTELVSVQKQIYELAYSFNSFFESKQCKINQPCQFMRMCSIFLLLSKWLNRNNYSDLILIQNEMDCSQPTSQIFNDNVQ